MAVSVAAIFVAPTRLASSAWTPHFALDHAADSLMPESSEQDESLSEGDVIPDYAVFRPIDFAQVTAILDKMAKVASPIVLLVNHKGEQVFTYSRGGDTRTPFPLASCSKWLTAAAAMTLVDSQDLSLDDPVSYHLPEFRRDKEAITLRMLMSHASGLPRELIRKGAEPLPVEGRHEKARGRRSRSKDLDGIVLQVARRARMESPPGKRFCYSNLSFRVVQRLLEVVTQKPWDDLFQQRLGGPCGMSHTRFTNAQRFVPDGGESTVEDFAAFLEMVRTGGIAVSGRRVLSFEAVEEMTRSHTLGMELGCLTEPGSHEKDEYGLGVWLSQFDAKTGRPQVVRHFGTAGFKGYIDYRRDMTVVLATRLKDLEKRKRVKKLFWKLMESLETIIPLSPPKEAQGKT